MTGVMASVAQAATAAAASASTMTTMLAHVSQRAVAAQRPPPPALAALYDRIKLCLVPFTAHDIYAVCTTAYHSDSIGLMADGDVMRGLADAFARVDQAVLTPFQANLITDTLRRAGVYTPPATPPALPDDVEAITPESLLAVLRGMAVTRTRDERVMDKVVQHYNALLDDATPTQLAETVCELSQLHSRAAEFMARAAARALASTTRTTTAAAAAAAADEASNNNKATDENNDVDKKDDSLVCARGGANGCGEELSIRDVARLARALAQTPGVPSHVTRRAFAAIEARMDELLLEDYGNVLLGLQACGVRYRGTFSKLVEAGLEHVESMDAVTLVRFLCVFAAANYTPRAHIEIYADALIDVAVDLVEDDLVYAFIALHKLQLLSESLFATMAANLLRYTSSMNIRHLAPVMEVCSRVAHDSSVLMGHLMVRVTDCYRALSGAQLGDVLAVLAHYPPARGHPMVGLLGKQAHLRLEMMTTESVANTVYALATLGYADPAFYLAAAETAFRFGFRSWAMLEPVLMGLSLSPPCPVPVCKVVASHLAPMSRSMSLQQVQRANHYLRTMQCEEDHVYRALAMRVQQFVKEVTAELPEDLQVLLQRGAILQPLQ